MEEHSFSKMVKISYSEIYLEADTFVQIHAGLHTVEVIFRSDDSVQVCVDDKSIVKTFDEVYLKGDL